CKYNDTTNIYSFSFRKDGALIVYSICESLTLAITTSAVKGILVGRFVCPVDIFTTAPSKVHLHSVSLRTKFQVPSMASWLFLVRLRELTVFWLPAYIIFRMN